MRKAITVTITNQKGGTAKTTTTLFLAHGLSSRGYRVLVVDLDQQEDTTFNLMQGKGYENRDQTSYEMLANQEQVQDCIVQIDLLIDLIPASDKLAVLDVALFKNNMYRATLLKEALEPIKQNYDFILIDTPPALSMVVTNALTASDRVLIPTQADLFSVKGLMDLQKTLDSVRNPNLNVMGILITRFNPRTVYSKALTAELNKVAKMMHTRVFQTKIKEAVTIKEALHQFKSLDDYAKRSNATKNVNQFIDEFLEVSENDNKEK